MDRKKIAVIGGAGYIGSHVSICLLKAGYDVHIVDNFSKSSPDIIKKIVDIQLDKVAGRLKSKDITIKATEKAKALISEEGFDPNLGARPLKRVIQRKVLDPLSLKIVAGLLREGDNVIIDADDGKIILKTSTEFKQKSKADSKKEKIRV